MRERCRIETHAGDCPPGRISVQDPLESGEGIAAVHHGDAVTLAGGRWWIALLSRYFSAVYIDNFPIADRLL